MKNYRNKKECPLCKRNISLSNFDRHYQACLIFQENNKSRKKKNRWNPGGWNKGLTKENSESMLKLSKTLKERIKTGIIKRNDHAQSEETKRKISQSMKKAHAEGRAWNIGKNRWNNKPSYPEEFFMKVIKNEFEDKDFQREYSIGIYSADFAWVEKKRIIEIDGDQHFKEEYSKRDKRKDEYLKSVGWEVLHIVWKELFHNPKDKILLAKNFIDN